MGETMQTEQIPLDEAIFKEVIGEGAVEYYMYMPHSRIGARAWEFKIRNQDGSRKIVVVRDYAFNISREVIKVKPFKSRTECNT